MMELIERIAIERECGRLPLLFARYADNGDHAALANLFTEDCEFARPFQPEHPFYGRDRSLHESQRGLAGSFTLDSPADAWTDPVEVPPLTRVWITRAEADWIARIAPHADYWWEEDGKRGLEPQSLWILARQYLACGANQRSTLPIELLLAFKPWREDSWRREKYQETLDRLGLKPLTYLWLLPEDSAEGDSDE